MPPPVSPFLIGGLDLSEAGYDGRCWIFAQLLLNILTSLALILAQGIFGILTLEYQIVESLSYRCTTAMYVPQNRRQSFTQSDPGHILYLPKKHEIRELSFFNLGLDDGCFNHPVVILSADERSDSATVLLVSTSLQGRPTFTLLFLD